MELKLTCDVRGVLRHKMKIDKACIADLQAELRNRAYTELDRTDIKVDAEEIAEFINSNGCSGPLTRLVYNEDRCRVVVGDVIREILTDWACETNAELDDTITDDYSVEMI